MRSKRRHLRKKHRLSTASMEPFILHWLERALADEQGRAFLRERLARHTTQLTEIQF